MKPAALPVLRATRLLDQVRERIRYKHYSLRTFVKWHGMRQTRDMGQVEIERFLGKPANERLGAAATHNQALSALLFLDREVLGIDLPWLDGVQRTREHGPNHTRLVRPAVAANGTCGESQPIAGACKS